MSALKVMLGVKGKGEHSTSGILSAVVAGVPAAVSPPVVSTPGISIVPRQGTTNVLTTIPSQIPVVCSTGSSVVAPPTILIPPIQSLSGLPNPNMPFQIIRREIVIHGTGGQSGKLPTPVPIVQNSVPNFPASNILQTIQNQRTQNIQFVNNQTTTQNVQHTSQANLLAIPSQHMVQVVQSKVPGIAQVGSSSPQIVQCGQQMVQIQAQGGLQIVSSQPQMVQNQVQGGLQIASSPQLGGSTLPAISLPYNVTIVHPKDIFKTKPPNIPETIKPKVSNAILKKMLQPKFSIRNKTKVKNKVSKKTKDKIVAFQKDGGFNKPNIKQSNYEVLDPSEDNISKPNRDGGSVANKRAAANRQPAIFATDEKMEIGGGASVNSKFAIEFSPGGLENYVTAVALAADRYRSKAEQAKYELETKMHNKMLKHKQKVQLNMIAAMSRETASGPKMSRRKQKLAIRNDLCNNSDVEFEPEPIPSKQKTCQLRCMPKTKARKKYRRRNTKCSRKNKGSNVEGQKNKQRVLGEVAAKTITTEADTTAIRTLDNSAVTSAQISTCIQSAQSFTDMPITETTTGVPKEENSTDVPENSTDVPENSTDVPTEVGVFVPPAISKPTGINNSRDDQSCMLVETNSSKNCKTSIAQNQEVTKSRLPVPVDKIKIEPISITASSVIPSNIKTSTNHVLQGQNQEKSTEVCTHADIGSSATTASMLDVKAVKTESGEHEEVPVREVGSGSRGVAKHNPPSGESFHLGNLQPHLRDNNLIKESVKCKKKPNSGSDSMKCSPVPVKQMVASSPVGADIPSESRKITISISCSTAPHNCFSESAAISLQPIGTYPVNQIVQVQQKMSGEPQKFTEMQPSAVIPNLHPGKKVAVLRTKNIPSTERTLLPHPAVGLSTTTPPSKQTSKNIAKLSVDLSTTTPPSKQTSKNIAKLSVGLSTTTPPSEQTSKNLARLSVGLSTTTPPSKQTSKNIAKLSVGLSTTTPPSKQTSKNIAKLSVGLSTTTPPSKQTSKNIAKFLGPFSFVQNPVQVPPSPLVPVQGGAVSTANQQKNVFVVPDSLYTALYSAQSSGTSHPLLSVQDAQSIGSMPGSGRVEQHPKQVSIQHAFQAATGQVFNQPNKSFVGSEQIFQIAPGQSIGQTVKSGQMQNQPSFLTRVPQTELSSPIGRTMGPTSSGTPDQTGLTVVKSPGVGSQGQVEILHTNKLTNFTVDMSDLSSVSEKSDSKSISQNLDNIESELKIDSVFSLSKVSCNLMYQVPSYLEMCLNSKLENSLKFCFVVLDRKMPPVFRGVGAKRTRLHVPKTCSESCRSSCLDFMCNNNVWHNVRLGPLEELEPVAKSAKIH